MSRSAVSNRAQTPAPRSPSASRHVAAVSGTVSSPSIKPPSSLISSRESLPIETASSEAPPKLEELARSADPGSIADIYDERYGSGKYASRFKGDQVTAGERRLVEGGLRVSNPLLLRKHREWSESLLRSVTDKKELAEIRPNTVTLLDFGAGDGRGMKLYERIAKEMQDIGKKESKITDASSSPIMREGAVVKVIAYDISPGGMEFARERLIRNGYIDMEEIAAEVSKSKIESMKESSAASSSGEGEFDADEEYARINEDLVRLVGLPGYRGCSGDDIGFYTRSDSDGSVEEGPRGGAGGESSIDDREGSLLNIHGIYRRNNLQIILVSPKDPRIRPEEISSALGEVDMSMILFGTTSHIFPGSDRDRFLEEIVNMTRGSVMATLPGQRMFREEQRIFRHPVFEGLGLKDGEVFYKPKEGGGGPLPYALYSAERLKDFLKRGGVKKPAEIFFSSYVIPPGMASRNPWLDYYDSMAAQVASSFMDDCPWLVGDAEYYGVVTSGRVTDIDDCHVVTSGGSSPSTVLRRRTKSGEEFVAEPLDVRARGGGGRGGEAERTRVGRTRGQKSPSDHGSEGSRSSGKEHED